MSSTGPPPRWKKKAGFGCQCSMPWVMKPMVPATGAADRALVDEPAGGLVAAAEEGVGRAADPHSLAAAAAAASARPSANVTPSGFSE